MVVVKGLLNQILVKDPSMRNEPPRQGRAQNSYCIVNTHQSLVFTDKCTWHMES